MQVEQFSSDRFTASLRRVEDSSILCRMHQDSAVIATLNGIPSNEQTQQYLHKNIEH
ncbi:hypothetical protein [Chroococcidiopsis sp. TS-821]|uniref:hypothetical protein n=1 Tax=Chroococcidiopsis sp. TS-821 TaxID=1378066 RepID=UPI00143D5CF3|nr:hypothetical protein [Chroococcidiopsis sp. TS-821]